MFHGWLGRPVGPAIGMPPGVEIPRCLDGYAIHRWEPQIGVDQLHGLPMWKPETLLCYMAARPSRFCWEDVSEWLWAVCENLELDLLVAELEGRSRAVWMKTGYLADVGERPDLGGALTAAAPAGGRGPYVLGWREAAVAHAGVGEPRAAIRIRDRRLPVPDLVVPEGGFRAVRAAQDMGAELSSLASLVTRTYPAVARRESVVRDAAVLDVAFDHLLYGLHAQGVYEGLDLTLKGGTALRKYHLGHRGFYAVDGAGDFTGGSRRSWQTLWGTLRRCAGTSSQRRGKTPASSAHSRMSSCART